MMRKKNIQLKFFQQNTTAVAGIIVAVMILGLVISVISIIQTVYVPKWMEEREAIHMNQVADQLAQLKYTLDTLVISDQPTPVTTSISLGSKELGFFTSSRAFGYFQIFSEEWELLLITENGNSYAYNFGTFKYSSQNAYFLDQTYIYENGAVLLSQAEGTALLNPPSFSVERTGSDISIIFSCVDLVAEGGKMSIGGYGTYPIRLQRHDKDTADYILGTSDAVTNEQEVQIIITTQYPVVWKQFFNKVLTDAGLTIDDGFDTPESCSLETTENQVTISFLNNNFAIDLSLTKTDINVQIAPGWVQ